ANRESCVRPTSTRVIGSRGSSVAIPKCGRFAATLRTVVQQPECNPGATNTIRNQTLRQQDDFAHRPASRQGAMRFGSVPKRTLELDLESEFSGLEPIEEIAGALLQFFAH